MYHISSIPDIQVPHIQVGKIHSKKHHDKQAKPDSGSFWQQQKQYPVVTLLWCAIFQRAPLFMSPNYKHHYWAQTRQFNSQLNGLHTELHIDAEFTWGKHIHPTHDASLKMSRYCPRALETKLSQCTASALKMSPWGLFVSITLFTSIPSLKPQVTK